MVILLSLFAVSCADKEKTEKAKPKVEAESMRLVARVQSRPGGKNFVLLEAYGKWTLEDGTKLYAYGSDGRTASLETSGEKLGQFVAADVLSGEVSIGDAVYHRTKPGEPAAAPATPTPAPITPPESPKEQRPAGSSVIEPVPLPSY